MLRQDAIAALVAHRHDAITVTTEQAIGAWRAAVAEPANHTPARPERKVLIVDGDGSLLMQLGSLVTIAGAAPSNLFHFVFENGVYETSGSQPLPAEGRFDLCQMARGGGHPPGV